MLPWRHAQHNARGEELSDSDGHKSRPSSQTEVKPLSGCSYLQFARVALVIFSCSLLALVIAMRPLPAADRMRHLSLDREQIGRLDL